MNKKLAIIFSLLAVVIIGTGVLVYKAVVGTKPVEQVDELIDESLPPVDSSIQVDVTKSKTEANTVVISVNGMGGKMTSLAYELTYDSEGLIKGVNSGQKPADVAGLDVFERPIYLGTCSRNVCKPDTGVTKISLVVQFTDTDGKRSQFSKEFTL